MIPHILVSTPQNPYDPDFYERYRKLGRVLIPNQFSEISEKEAEVWVVDFHTRVTDKEISNMPRLQYLVTPTTGLTHINITSKSVKIIKLDPKELAEVHSVSEFVLRIILSHYRPYGEIGRTVNGKCLGIIGLGRIGKQLVSKALALGMKLGAVDVYDCEETFQSLFKDSDVISIHVNETEKTKGLISKELIALMKKDALLINTARDSIWDQKAVIAACKEERIYAASDFKEDLLGQFYWKDKRFITFPHQAGYTIEDRIFTETLIVKKLKEALDADRTFSLRQDKASS